MDNQNNNGFGTGNQQNDAGQQSYYSQNNSQSYYSQSNDQQSYYGQTTDQSAQQNVYGQTADQSAQQNVYGQTTDQNAYGQNYTQYNQQNTYGQQTYSPYGYNANNGMGGAPLDKNGQPMKNRFGMKLTFSILEILCCSIITLIGGICGCVFTVKANSAYKEGRWEDFKSHAKKATIFLWVGFAGVILSLVLGIVVVAISIVDVTTSGSGNDDYSYSYEYEYDDDDDYDYDYNYATETETEEPETEVVDTQVEETESTETPVVATDIVPGEGFTTPSLTVDGVDITLPMSYADLKAAGFYIDSEDEEYIINKEEYEWKHLYNPNGEDIGYVYIVNLADSAIEASEGLVFGLDFYYDDYRDAAANVVLYNGVTQNTTSEDLITAFGTPDYEYISDTSDYSVYQWYNHNDEYYDSAYNSVEFTYMDGGMSEMVIRYLGWDD